jgi:hypothetical protein
MYWQKDFASLKKLKVVVVAQSCSSKKQRQAAEDVLQKITYISLCERGGGYRAR